MKKLLIIYILIFISNLAFSQIVTKVKDFKLSNIQFKVYKKSEFQKDYVQVVINPNKSKNPASNIITDILTVGDTVWFSTESGLMRTTDHFSTFDSYYGFAPFGNDGIAGLAIMNNLVVVSTATNQEISGENIQVGTGIKVSTDAGFTWNSFSQPVDGRYDTTIIYGSNVISALPVVVPQQNVSFDIKITRTKNDLTNYTIWIASWGGELRKSTDYGNTWQRVVLPPDDLDSININDTGYTFSVDVRHNFNHTPFSIAVSNDSTIYVGTANGINKSTDWGLSWRKFNFKNSGTGTNKVSGDFVVNMYIQRYNGKEIVWGATKKAEDPKEINAVSYSSNGGLSWAYTLADIAPNNISSIDSIVYAQTDGGLWRAMFPAFDWSKPGLIYDETTKDQLKTNTFFSGGNQNDTIYFGSGDGLIRTIENGQAWANKWKIFRAIQPIDLNSKLKTYAAPNPFAPNTEITRIYYKTGKPSSKITIKIFDFGMNPVRTVIQNAVRNSPEELFTLWDGKNNNGNQVANGVYFYRVEVDSDTPVWGKILVMQ
jgi:hypothetical protein